MTSSAAFHVRQVVHSVLFAATGPGLVWLDDFVYEVTGEPAIVSGLWFLCWAGYGLISPLILTLSWNYLSNRPVRERVWLRSACGLIANVIAISAAVLWMLIMSLGVAGM